jgi:hypothetical protein
MVAAKERALDRWAAEGGSIPVAPREPERKGVPLLPSLPPGCESQPAWGFRDRPRRLAYEFHHVYRPPRLGKLGMISVLDEDLSYWSLSWPTDVRAPDEPRWVRWMSYAEARKLRGSKMTFKRFSSLSQMREELPGLLYPGESDA